MSGCNPPQDKRCFVPCPSCFRCSDYRVKAECASCPGRLDTERRRYPDPDDFCDCKNGVLRYRLRTGKLVMRRFESSPFEATVKTDAVSEYEADWNRFIQQKREELDDPGWDPIRFLDGMSTFDWNKLNRGE